MVICLERGADLHMAQLMPLPLTVSCFSRIQIGLPFWCSPGQRAVKRVCVCVFIFDSFCYLNIYHTDLGLIFVFGRTIAVDERSEVSFQIVQGTLPTEPVSVGFIGFYPPNWVVQ